MSATQGVLVAVAAAGGILLLMSSKDTKVVENPVTGEPPVNRELSYGEPGYTNDAIAQPPQTHDPYENEIPMPDTTVGTTSPIRTGTCMINGSANPVHGTGTFEWAHHSPDACFTFHEAKFRDGGYTPYVMKAGEEYGVVNGKNVILNSWQESVEEHLGYQYHDGMYVTPNRGTTLIPLPRESPTSHQLYTIYPTNVTTTMGDPITPDQVAEWTETEAKPCFIDCPGGYTPAIGFGSNGQPNYIQNKLPLQRNECKAMARAACAGGKYTTLGGHTGVYWGNEQVANASYSSDIWDLVVKGQV